MNHLSFQKDEGWRAHDTAETLDAASPAVGAARATHAVGRWARVGIALAAPLLWLGLSAEARADDSGDVSAETTALVDSASSDEPVTTPTTDPSSEPPAPEPVAPAPEPAPPAPEPVPVVDPPVPAPEAGPNESIVVIDPREASLELPSLPDELLSALAMPAVATADRGSGSAAASGRAGDGRVSSERSGGSPLPAPRPDSTPVPAPSGGATGGSSNGFSLGAFAALTALLTLASQRLGGLLQLTVPPLRPPLLVSHLKRPG